MRKLIIGSVALAILGVAGPALANTPGNSTETQTFSCANPSPDYAAPTDAECPKDANGNPDPNGTYTRHTNDVQCDDSSGTDLTVARGYMGSNGGELCNDGTTSPVQGRIYGTGGTNGASLTIDGDKDNGDGAPSGWITVNVSSSPSVTCGGTDGNRDSEAPGPEDSAAACDPTA